VNAYLIDTNVLSELTKLTPDVRVEAFLRQSRDRVFVSVLSIGEIRKGIGSLASGMGSRLLPVSLEIAERWGDLSAALRGKGRPRPVIDAILTATALHHDLIVVTRNVADYEGLGVSVLNPWDAE
jgi:predicted nucleic acid-binding protein